MNKQEAIKYFKYFKAKKDKYIVPPSDIRVSIAEVIDIISQIHEPQKVVVSKFVAEWIEECKGRGCPLRAAMKHINLPDKVNAWFLETGQDEFTYPNQDIFARAWLDGFEIEQEKLYTVEIPNPNNTSPKYKLMLIKGINGVEILRDYYNEKRDPYIFQLTESEIKQDFEWAWQFAVPVEVE
ncbi:DUF1642 domain-containing protein [Streptococcus suis]|uniref:DUF1642 domain-containing protein n=1 Tax=Streptococcus suis TaxID=1307 RepID=UPI001CF5AFAF|nr:DUF1642 domain-containing protein [Streptococcus suis]MCB2890372.1 DUF1642 domain-containing protein [Streptococcus suis]